jgi:hypothetical protein
MQNCIFCGEHSGFFHSITLLKKFKGKNGMIAYSEKFSELKKYKLNENDIVIVESGMHGEQMALLKRTVEHVNEIKSKYPSKIIWMVTWSPNFPTHDGRYNQTELGYMRQRNESLECRHDSTSVYRLKREFQIISTIKAKLDGILWLDGTNSLGRAKVGGSWSGSHGDCLHFCLPGPPDEIARALQWMLIGLQKEEYSHRNHSHNHTGHSIRRPFSTIRINSAISNIFDISDHQQLPPPYHSNIYVIVVFVGIFILIFSNSIRVKQ